MTYDQILQDKTIQTYIRQADASMAALGFTEHSFPHVKRVAQIAGDLLQTLDVSGLAEGADEVGQIIALIQRVELHGGATDDLEDDVDRAGLAVISGNGQRDALAVLGRAQDDKLAGLGLLRDQRSLDDHLGDGRVQRLLFDDLEHAFPLL